MPKISILIFLLELHIGFDSVFNFDYNSFNLVYPASIGVGESNYMKIIEIINNNFSFNSDIMSYSIVKFNIESGVPEILTSLLLISSFLSLIVGAILGLSQIRIKRLLAYSTINHIGFLLLSLAVFSNASIEAFIFYIIQYTITNLNIFLIILALSYINPASVPSILSSASRDGEKREERGKGEEKITFSMPILKEKGPGFPFRVNSKMENNFEANMLKSVTISVRDIEYIKFLKGFFYINPLLSISFSISLFSLAGVPPLIGFFAKQQVLYSSNSAGYFFLSLIAILVSVISAYYYLKIIKIIHSPSSKTASLKKNKNPNVTIPQLGHAQLDYFYGSVELEYTQKINVLSYIDNIHKNRPTSDPNKEAQLLNNIDIFIKYQIISNIHC